jgi:hypothetical protein
LSAITELLDRLSGIAVVRERLGDTAKRVDHLADRLLDHERRLTRLETLAPPDPPRGPRQLARK